MSNAVALIVLVTLEFVKGCNERLPSIFVDEYADADIKFEVSAPNGSWDIFEVSYQKQNIGNSTPVLRITYSSDKEPSINKLEHISFYGDAEEGNIFFKVHNMSVERIGTYDIRSQRNSQVMQCLKVFRLGKPTTPVLSYGSIPEIGGSLNFKCNSSSTTAPRDHGLSLNYTWKIVGDTDASGNRFTYLNNILRIFPVNLQDKDARVTCLATEIVKGGQTSNTSNELTIDVYYGPDNIGFNPPAVNYTKRSGDILPNITCEADCNPTCVYGWTKDGSPIVEQSGRILSLHQLEPSESGIYTCTATRHMHSKTQNLLINVIYGPSDVRLIPPAQYYIKDELTELGLVRCHSDCWPCVYEWTGPRTTSVPHTSSDANISFSSLDREDHGNYTCTVRNTNTQVTEIITILVEVRYGPDAVNLEPPQTYYHIYEGDSLHDIFCKAECFPRCSYTWSKRIDERFQHVSSSATLSLRMDLNRTYAGEYICNVNNSDSSKWKKTADLTVNVSWPPSKLMIAPVGNEFPWLEGQTGTLNCTANETGNPPGTVIWHSTVGSISTQSQLKISPLTYQHDNLSVRCEMRNNFTSHKGTLVEKNTFLQVQYKPRLEVQSDRVRVTKIIVVEGKNREITCLAFGNPQPRVMWLENSGLSSDGKLKFTHIDRSQAGIYTCQALAESSRYPTYDFSDTTAVTVIVHYPPEVHIEEAGYLEETEKLNLTCVPIGVPNEYNYHSWKQTWRDEDITSNDVLQIGSSITIPSLQLQDSGNYTCSVDNNITDRNNRLFQYATKEILVKVRPTLFTSDLLFAGRYLKDTTISIPFYSYPMYKKVTVKLQNGTVIQNSSKHTVAVEPTTIGTKFYGSNVVLSGHSVIITIKGLVEDDFAEYCVIITNDNNKTEVYFTLRSESIPVPPTYFHLLDVNGNTARFVWERGFNGGHKQTFLIQLADEGQNNWSNKTFVNEDDNYNSLRNKTYRANITGLKPGSYRFQLVAINAIGSTKPLLLSTVVEIASSAETDAAPFPFGAAVGGGLGATILIIIAVFLVVLWKRRSLNKKDDYRKNILTTKRQPIGQDSADTGEVINPMYESAEDTQLPPPNDLYAEVKKQTQPVKSGAIGDVYSQVQRHKNNNDINTTAAKGQDLYSTPVKKGKGKQKKMKKQEKKKSAPTMKQRDDTVYENAECRNHDNKHQENVYENPANTSLDEKPSRTRNDQGLIYIDVDLPKPALQRNQKPVIHGEEDRTIYAEVAYGEVGEQLPESDEDEKTKD